MPTSLTFEEHGEGIGNAWTVLRDNAARAGLSAPVPTCPGWTVRDLVAHQGMVHRWAAGCVRGERDDEACEAIEREGLEAPDALAWLDEGAKDLLSTLAFAPVDRDVWFFLPDSPGPRNGWARRQCHETTIHAVDAMAAARGAAPPAAETWIRPDLAIDGVDELLMGFLPRRRNGLELAVPRTLVVRTTDTGNAWTLRVGEGRTTSRVGGPATAGLPAGGPAAGGSASGGSAAGGSAAGPSRGASSAARGSAAGERNAGERDAGGSNAAEPGVGVPDAGGSDIVEVTGTAAQVYLALWNRGDQVTCTDLELLARWRSDVQVLW